MKLPAVLLSLMLAAIATADSAPQLPTCAQKCADSFLTKGIGNCGTDIKCICKDKSFLGEIACCLQGDCGQKEQEEAVAYAKELCNGAGVTGLPTAVTCDPAAASATATSSDNYGARQTAHAGLGAIGGIVAAAIML